MLACIRLYVVLNTSKMLEVPPDKRHAHIRLIAAVGLLGALLIKRLRGILSRNFRC